MTSEPRCSDGRGSKYAGAIGEAVQIDNCVNKCNPYQEGKDDDGRGGACDNCPAHPNPQQRVLTATDGATCATTAGHPTGDPEAAMAHFCLRQLHDQPGSRAACGWDGDASGEGAPGSTYRLSYAGDVSASGEDGLYTVRPGEPLMFTLELTRGEDRYRTDRAVSVARHF